MILTKEIALSAAGPTVVSCNAALAVASAVSQLNGLAVSL